MEWNLHSSFFSQWHFSAGRDPALAKERERERERSLKTHQTSNSFALSFELRRDLNSRIPGVNIKARREKTMIFKSRFLKKKYSQLLHCPAGVQKKIDRGRKTTEWNFRIRDVIPR